jgi:hypothetical protein
MPLAVITGEQVKINGQIGVEVQFEEITARLRLIIADTGKTFTPLLGRDWLDILRPDWRNVFKVNSISSRSKKEFVRNLQIKYPGKNFS